MRRVSAFAAAVALLALGARPGGATSTTRYRLAGLGLSIALPAGWMQIHADPGWTFKAAVPTTGTSLFLNSFAANRAKGTFHSDLEAFERSTALTQDPHAKVTVRHTTVAGANAIEITARYNSLTAHLYGFTHAGTDYTLEWVAKTSNLADAESVFANGLRSLRFLNT